MNDGKFLELEKNEWKMERELGGGKNSPRHIFLPR